MYAPQQFNIPLLNLSNVRRSLSPYEGSQSSAAVVARGSEFSLESNATPLWVYDGPQLARHHQGYASTIASSTPRLSSSMKLSLVFSPRKTEEDPCPKEFFSHPYSVGLLPSFQSNAPTSPTCSSSSYLLPSWKRLPPAAPPPPHYFSYGRVPVANEECSTEAGVIPLHFFSSVYDPRTPTTVAVRGRSISSIGRNSVGCSSRDVMPARLPKVLSSSSLQRSVPEPWGIAGREEGGSLDALNLQLLRCAEVVESLLAEWRVLEEGVSRMKSYPRQ